MSTGVLRTTARDMIERRARAELVPRGRWLRANRLVTDPYPCLCDQDRPCAGRPDPLTGRPWCPCTLTAPGSARCCGGRS